MCKLNYWKLKLIEEEIENLLDVYPEKFYQATFTIPDLHQKLVLYVMNNLPDLYRLIDKGTALLIKNRFPYHSLELRLQVEDYINAGIADILAENQNILCLDIEPHFEHLNFE